MGLIEEQAQKFNDRLEMARQLVEQGIDEAKSVAATLDISLSAAYRCLNRLNEEAASNKTKECKTKVTYRPIKVNVKTVKADVTTGKLKAELQSLRKRYAASCDVISDLEEKLSIYEALPQEPTDVGLVTVDTGKRKAVPVIVASDWHIEETVKSSVTNRHNEYNLAIAKDSISQFFHNATQLVLREKRTSDIDTVVLALLGDIINGVLRAEDYQTNAITPIDAVALARDLIHAGINKLHKETKCHIHVVCCVGNHGRITGKIFPSDQAHNSLEYSMYKTLERDFKQNKAISFNVSESYYTMENILGMQVRFHHGHAFKFLGGIGGISVPIMRKISQLNQIDKADLDVCGHFHTMQIFNNCIMNGSLVGMNGYSMQLGLPYEPPRQTFFLIDSKYGRSVVAPVFIDRDVTASK